MKLLRKRHALVLCLCIASSLRAQGSSRVAYGPRLTLDLRNFGYEEIRDPQTELAYQVLKNRVVMLDDGTLAVSLFVRNRSRGTPDGSQGSKEGYLFRTVFLDGRAGSLLGERTWSEASLHCGLFPVPGGGFLIWDGRALSVYSPGGGTLSSISLADYDSQEISVQQSPSGRTLFVTRRKKDGEHVLCLRSSDLREIAKFDLNYTQATGSDSYFAMVVESKGEGSLYVRPELRREVIVYGPLTQDVKSRKFTKVFATTRPSWDLESRQDIITRNLPEKDRALWASISVHFIDDQDLAVTNGNELRILNLSGNAPYDLQVHRGWVTRITTCRGCDVLAFGTYTMKGGLQLFDLEPIFPSREQEHEVVLLNHRTHNTVELPMARPIRAVSALALSADGCVLAQQADWRLEVFRICGTEIGKQLGLNPMNQ